MNSNQGFAYDENEASPYDRGTVAAIFDTRDDAKHALQDLHDAGFHKTWMGVTTAADTAAGTYNDPGTAPAASTGGTTQVETAEGGFGASIARFFGEDGRESLYDALTKRGVPQSDALALDHQMLGGGAVITVEAKDRYDEVLQILQKGRGEVSSTAAAGALGETSARTRPPVSDSASMAAPGKDIDDTRTMQLREERLSVDKERVSSGEATLEKRVVSADASVDVPVMHEELFIQRRPVAEGTRAAAGTIGTDETIRIPLMREQVVVDKRTVVREEVSIGKRAVTNTERVDGSVRHEELVVDDAAENARTRATDASAVDDVTPRP